MSNQDFIVLDKQVGETPLQCAEAWRATQPDTADTPLAYAGRLDPMASGKLLVLIGDECKKQEAYHGLDKEYVFEVLLGTASDTGDVLGLVTGSDAPTVSEADCRRVAKALIGAIELPYPHFSSKTVHGKPLHVWTLEGRLDEITIPTKTSTLHQLTLEQIRTVPGTEVYATVTKKIETIPPVTEASKALGNDFRRPAVRQSWQDWQRTSAATNWQIATFRCIASSGTYMRTLAAVIARELNTTGLAYSIHRTTIGTYHNQRWSSRYSSHYLYYDHICNLCNTYIQFVQARTRSKNIVIKPIQTSSFANAQNQYDSVIYQVDETIYIKSEAVRQLLLHFGGGWKVLAACMYIIPTKLRDWVYDRVAKNRYRLFGTTHID